MIRSFQGTSLIEYPGRIASVLFSAGCNYACPFCHNPELVNVDLLDGEYSLSHDTVLENLREREGFIDAVVLTGGEPLLYERNVQLLERIGKETALSIKLDTNGSLPDMLREALKTVDYVAMDLKSSPDKYIFATGGRGGFERVRESGRLIMESGVDYEFRTTMVPGLVNDSDVLALLDRFPGTIKRYALQRFRSEKTLSDELTGMPSYPGDYLEKLAEKLAPRVTEVVLRV